MKGKILNLLQEILLFTALVMKKKVNASSYQLEAKINVDDNLDIALYKTYYDFTPGTGHALITVDTYYKGYVA